MRNLLSAGDLSAEEITQLFYRVSHVGRWAEVTRRQTLRGGVVANLFYEPSTRTRLSFELAATKLGADVITFDPGTSAEQKGESMRDTVLTLQALGANAIVVRSSVRGIPQKITQWVSCSVINAGDGDREHPTQALLDLYTMKKHFGRIAGLRVGIVGDVHHSRVANSLYYALATMGAETVLIGPKELVSSRPGPFVKYDLDAELPKLDVCYMLRLQSERRRYITDDYARLELRIYGEKFGLTKGRMAMLPGHAVVMHPGPMNRGVEIDSDVADSPRSLIQEQVTNGVKVRAALLYWLLKEENGTTARGA